MLRTHTCGELRAENADQEVTLAGWVDTLRTSGKIGFLLIRDRYGITQCFLNAKILESLGEVRRESVVQVTGVVKKRPENQVKKNMATGEIELSVQEATLLSEADPLPLELDESIESTEETRLTYRYLDLRKPRMQKNIMLRHNVHKAMRDFLSDDGFVEIETPVLAKSTPEGARDYIVPSRVNKGSFYALPQSPQTFKQLLMISGYDKYFQIARCFRDEDLRSDRQPEFSQLDIEMSFVEEDDVLSSMERMMAYVWKQVRGEDLEIPFERISYADAMSKHGRDNPDLRKDGEEFKFCWVVDFPMFEDKDGNITYTHHPFTQPKATPDEIRSKPLEISSSGYDLVLNGQEIGGGSIRIHNQDVQKAVFETLGLSKSDIEEKFGFFMQALKYGTPPHGGIAFGLDRFCSILAGEDSIREVIAFPKTKDAEDLMLQAPSTVEKGQLDDLGLTTK